MTSEGSIDRAGPVLAGALAPPTFLVVDPAGWYAAETFSTESSLIVVSCVRS